MANSLPNFYYNFDKNFYYDYIGNRDFKGGRFQELRTQAISHFNSVSLPYSRSNYQHTVATLEALAIAERAKENKLLNEVYVKKGNLDIATLTDRQLVRLMTDAMSIRGTWDRTLKAIDENKPKMLRDNKARMEKYLYQNVLPDIMQKHLREVAREIGGYIQQGLKDGSLDKKELEKYAESKTLPVFERAISKTIDDLAKDTSSNESIQGYKDLKRMKDELSSYYKRWVEEVGHEMFVDLGFLNDLDNLIKDVERNSKNIRGATTRTANWMDLRVKSAISSKKQIAQKAGLLAETTANLMPILNGIVNEALEKFHVVGKNVGRRGTVDNLQLWMPKGDFAKVSVDMRAKMEGINEKLNGSDKEAARKGYEKFFEEARGTAAESTELYSRSYFVKTNNKEYDLSRKGSFLGGQQRLDEDISKIFGYGEMKGVYSLLANTAPGGLMHGTDKHEDLLVSLGAHIGNFLFDDYTEIGKQGDLNVIHVLNLNKNIIPLSVFLFGLAKAFQTANSEIEQVRVQAGGTVSKIEIGDIASAAVTYPQMDTSIRGGYPAWRSQAGKAYQNIDVQLTFYKNFLDIVREWI